ncbi:hypothetical protein [Streptomyces zagrosensis]|uniref:Uncharacterized protein n=1 Tax=Streptomyces zagrosensis TaxID=1042984 RepID=A0A7W9Q890_9ACTN|nr:hypothetical protein [Streptomyces zagrosensis]MBB5934372.1 hypothetical protein [Streptomyces zagrosensis]
MAPLEWVPLAFRYRFRCADDACPTHGMALKGWEAGAPYGKFLRMYGERAVQDKLRERWYDSILTRDRTVHFFIGNIAAHPRTFMLLSVMHPKAHVVQYVQDSLFGGCRRVPLNTLADRRPERDPAQVMPCAGQGPHPAAGLVFQPGGLVLVGSLL